MELYSDWLDINEESNGQFAIVLQKEMILLTTKIQECETAVYCLKLVYDNRLVNIINDNGIELELFDFDSEDYKSKLEYVENMISNWIFERELKEKDYNELMKSLSGVEPNKFFFDKWLVTLARYMQVPFIRKSEITTKEFAFMKNDYIRYVDTIKGKQGGKKQ